MYPTITNYTIWNWSIHLHVTTVTLYIASSTDLLNAMTWNCFWENVVIYFNNIHNTNFSLNKEHIIFGVLEHTHTPMIIYLNTYILIAKFWIHLCRLKQHNPELQGFTKILFKHIENEKYINTRYNTLDKFNIIWEQLYI